ncbi:cell division protein ZapA [Jannaschia rubra]|uniref:Cell division protein ZapA n=1 Tax=Jannaschia rubra TaxID=282197 RepID=A0A0M6XVT7_9RHOB|nr:cell division protein ZapA [Jannaschia rubra]CTQ34215.1 Cell division protein ZapA [Jannaschia rubra]SFG20422.1 cell division protein ZapA [Jannaschia rubra]
MPDMTIEIGGRSFQVACQPGEEGYLNAAAEMLDREAQALVASGTRLTQDRMLLMAGLMLADKAISAEEELRTLDRRLVQQTQLLDEMQAHPKPEPEVREVVKEVVPQSAIDRIDTLAARAEDLAARAREMAGN